MIRLTLECDTRNFTPAQLQALQDIVAEYLRAVEKHSGRPFNSRHEGYAVLLEEVDELWDDIKANRCGRKEAAQVGAMAWRMMAEGFR